MTVRSVLRRTRDWCVPLNHLITDSVRGVSRVAGVVSRYAETHGVRVGEITSSLPDGQSLHLVADPGDGIATIVWWHGWSGYEPEATSLWYRYAQNSTVVLDVGANSGLFALLAAYANPKAHVHAFEPVPDTFRALSRNCAVNPTVHIDCHQIAVTDTKGPLWIRTDPRVTNDLMATVEDSHPVKTAGDRQLTEVRCDGTDLDSFLSARSVGPVDLVKIDVETAEPRVLQGMRRTIEEDHPTILLEVLTPGVATAVEEIAQEAGYHRYILTPTSPIEVPRVRAVPGFRNYLLSCAPVRDETTEGEGTVDDAEPESL